LIKNVICRQEYIKSKHSGLHMRRSDAKALITSIRT